MNLHFKRFRATLFGLLLGALSILPGFATGEIKTTDTSGKTLYAVVLSPTGTAWSVTTGGTATANTFAALASGNWTTYAVTDPEIGSTGVFVGNFPTGIASAAHYSILIYEQQGSSPAPTDVLVAQGAIDWTGSVMVGASDLNTAALAVKAKTDQLAFTSGNLNANVQAYASGQDPASYILVTPANKLATDSSHNVTLASASATSLINGIFGFVIDPLTTTGHPALTFLDGFLMTYEGVAGPYSTSSTSSSRTSTYLRNDLSGTGYTSGNSITSGANTNRTITIGTLP